MEAIRSRPWIVAVALAGRVFKRVKGAPNEDEDESNGIEEKECAKNCTCADQGEPGMIIAALNVNVNPKSVVA